MVRPRELENLDDNEKLMVTAKDMRAILHVHIILKSDEPIDEKQRCTLAYALETVLIISSVITSDSYLSTVIGEHK